MSSPIAHAAAGLAVYSIVKHRLPAGSVCGLPARLAWPGIAVAISLLPDLDVLAALVFGSMEKFHNNLTHSLLIWILATCFIAPALKVVTGISIRLGFLFTLVLCHLHILIDYFTYGRGVMLFWPVTAERFHAPITLFMGVPWADRLTSPNYLQMLLEDCFFAAIVLSVAIVIRKFNDCHQEHASKPDKGVE